ncbi:carbon-nitrogen hydrolase family protein [Gordonia hydrophobica]|uniref:Carbon-nitrogen hydrolase family protein n=1 Tax=Gordonia hydrophobica TaxID=40516 RepID=A0ABZ2U6A2_9ACTN|nr:carbon-nitrogen hydrolase family protein [Gordonia hydrophobica]MBM7367992.1 putative amidohydrolase [Gordonia hydrophobica]
MRLAMAQISSTDDPSANLRTVVDQTRSAAADGAELVVFPEATMCRFGVPLRDVAQPLDGPWASDVVRVADAEQITVVAGMFTPDPDGRIRNTVLVARPGEAPVGYDKIHLYDAFGFAESATVAPGRDPLVVEVAGHLVGVATCYDIRFPALFVELARRGAELIVVPTSWGAGPGKVAQWEVLSTARALDATTYIAAVGQALPTDISVRNSSAPTGIGHSRLSDPFGSVIADYDSAVQTGVHDIDLGLTHKARTALAVLANTREIPRLDGT